MHPLTTDLSEQILALIRMEAYSLLGAIQDNKVVLGGSAGSGGGTGEPPAGFVGQLIQSNVTFDTAGSSRACSAGSAGSSSLVDNLDAIRLGIEICDDAIQERHIDWGHGAGQVSAVDVPFQSSSGSIVATDVREAIEEAYLHGEGGYDWGQVVTVNAVSGGDYTTVNAALASITDAAANKKYTILVLTDTTETGVTTCKEYVNIVGIQRSVTINLGDYMLLCDKMRLQSISATNDEFLTLYLDEVGAAPVLWGVDVENTGTSTGANALDIDSGLLTAYDCTFNGAGSNQPRGVALGGSSNITFTAYSCVMTASGRALSILAGAATAITYWCRLSGGNDVYVDNGSEWRYFDCQYDPSNIWYHAGATITPLDGTTLESLFEYSRGDIIRGGASAWEDYSAKTLGAVLIGDGTDIISDTTPSFVGLVTMGAGLTLDGASTENIITVPYNVDEALNLVDTDGLEYMRVTSGSANDIGEQRSRFDKWSKCFQLADWPE